jgi:hypothetical protein
MARISNPFASRPSSPGPSPLASTARSFSPRINVESAEEASRAARVLADMKAGAKEMAPSFKPVPTPAPFTTTTDVPVPVKSEAGGSNT